MSFDVHPILEPGQRPSKGVWYAVAPEGGRAASGSQDSGPCPRVGAGANFLQAGEVAGRVLLSAGATPEGPYSDLYQLLLQKGIELNSLEDLGHVSSQDLESGIGDPLPTAAWCIRSKKDLGTIRCRLWLLS